MADHADHHDDGDDEVLRSEQPRGALSEAAGLATPSSFGPGPTTTTATAATTTFRYRRGGRLGRGGMGVVDAGHDPALGRDVALKRATDDSGEGLLRNEARLTARLNHPAIVSVLDLVRDDDGALVSVLEVRRGEGLVAAIIRDRERHPAEGGPSPRLLRALLVVCEAVAHAHGLGIVHRDLSPSNVRIDLDGAVSVLDWGLAATVVDAARQAVRLGTPGSIAPEVMAGGAATTASDVWSLGTLLGLVVADRGHPALRAIVARARHPVPADRYPDAGALADDLRRFLDGNRVLAFAEGPGAWLARQVQRHPRVVVAAAAIVTAAATAASALSVVVDRERQQANLARAHQLVDAAEVALLSLAPDNALAARRLAASALSMLDDDGGLDDDGVGARARGVVAATARVVAVSRPPSRPAPLGDDAIDGLDLDGGRRIARASRQGTRTVVRATTTLALVDGGDQGGRRTVHRPCPAGVPIQDAVPLDAGGAIVLCGAGEVLWLDDDGATRPVLVDVDPTRLRQAQSLALPHDDVLAIGTTRGRVVVVDLKDGAARGSIELGGGPVDVDEGPRPGTVLCHRRDGDLVFDVDSGALVPVAADGVDTVGSVAGFVDFHGRSALVQDDANRLWLGDGGGEVLAVDLHTGRRIVSAAGPVGVIKSIAVQSRGDVVVIAAVGPGGFRFHDARTGAELPTAWQHDPDVRMRHVAFVDDDTLLAWNWNEGPFLVPLTSSPDGSVTIGPIRSARVEARIDLDVVAVTVAAGAVWTLLGDGRIERIVPSVHARNDDDDNDIARTVVATVPGGRAVAAAGPHLVVATTDTVVRVVAGVPTVALTLPGALIDAVATDDGGRVAVGLRSGRVQLFDDDGTLRLDVAAHDERCAVLSFCDGGRALCSGGWDGRVRVIDVEPPGQRGERGSHR